jgi:hypothetical protein
MIKSAIGKVFVWVTLFATWILSGFVFHAYEVSALVWSGMSFVLLGIGTFLTHSSAQAEAYAYLSPEEKQKVMEEIMMEDLLITTNQEVGFALSDSAGQLLLDHDDD